MLVKEITYTDFNEKPCTEKFHFNLTKAEVMRMLLTDSDATMDQVFEYLEHTRNAKEMLKMVEDLIQSSYGIKSPDGKSFIKTPELLQAFVQSDAYSELLMELLGDADKTAEFFIGIVPSSLKDDLARFYKEHPNVTPEDVQRFAEEQKNQQAAGAAIPAAVSPTA